MFLFLKIKSIANKYMEELGRSCARCFDALVKEERGAELASKSFFSNRELGLVGWQTFKACSLGDVPSLPCASKEPELNNLESEGW